MKRLFLLIIMIVCTLFSYSQERQRKPRPRPGPEPREMGISNPSNLDEEAKREAQALWDLTLRKCGGYYWINMGPATTNPNPNQRITDYERSQGIEWQGTTSSHPVNQGRIFESKIEAKLRKRNGKWELDPINGPFCIKAVLLASEDVGRFFSECKKGFGYATINGTAILELRGFDWTMEEMDQKKQSWEKYLWAGEIVYTAQSYRLYFPPGVEGISPGWQEEKIYSGPVMKFGYGLRPAEPVPFSTVEPNTYTRRIGQLTWLIPEAKTMRFGVMNPRIDPQHTNIQILYTWEQIRPSACNSLPIERNAPPNTPPDDLQKFAADYVKSKFRIDQNRSGCSIQGSTYLEVRDLAWEVNRKGPDTAEIYIKGQNHKKLTHISKSVYGRMAEAEGSPLRGQYSLIVSIARRNGQWRVMNDPLPSYQPEMCQ